MAQSRRKRKRAKARGDRPETRTPVLGAGELRADWTLASVEDSALIRQAIRENWPVENGEAILEALSSGLTTMDRPRRGLRVAQLFLSIDRAAKS